MGIDTEKTDQAETGTMDGSNCEVLAAVVDAYDETDSPVCAESLVDGVDSTKPAVRDRLEELEDCELLCPDGSGYRPTVTGREFLELDIDCGPVIVDPEPGE